MRSGRLQNELGMQEIAKNDRSKDVGNEDAVSIQQFLDVVFKDPRFSY